MTAHSSPSHSGFPSPADDYLEKNLDLNERLIKHPASTFFIKVKGCSMKEWGIAHGDLLIVDRSIQEARNRVIVAIVNGDLTVRHLRMKFGRSYLSDGNAEIEVTSESDFQMWGVVTHVIHEV